MKTILLIILKKLESLHTELTQSEMKLKEYQKLSKSLQNIQDFINHTLKQIVK